MSLTADQAKAIANYTLADFENERAATKNVIGAIPAGQEKFKPSPKCREALELAWHLAGVDVWFLDSICAGSFNTPEPERPANVRTGKDVAAWYEANLPAALARARGLSGDHLAKTMDFFGKMQMPGAAFLTLMVKHSVHHRGQLSAYLRPMGGTVPSIYGPSGDSH